LKLTRFVRGGMTNDDNWRETIAPLLQRDVKVPKSWHAIHWSHEMWRTLRNDGGYYKGRRYVDRVPEKDCVDAGSTLGRLYRDHGLTNTARTPVSAASAAPALPVQVAPLIGARARQPIAPALSDQLHLNLLVPSLA